MPAAEEYRTNAARSRWLVARCRFQAPRSYTGEDVVEISCHGSPYIVRKIIQLFLNKGARLARPGEFTKRAYMNGKFDLAQAEAVADLIASDSEMAHKAAWVYCPPFSRTPGGYPLI